MSSPVLIPSRRGARASSAAASSPSPPSSTSSSYAHSSGSASVAGPSIIPGVSSPLRAVMLPPDTPAAKEGGQSSTQSRRASLMSSSLAASEHTVINVGGPDGPPRLITCVRSSQGFDWNQEIFLPSHYDHLIPSDLERKRDPVHDIYLTEEEMDGILPH